MVFSVNLCEEKEKSHPQKKNEKKGKKLKICDLIVS